MGDGMDPPVDCAATGDKGFPACSKTAGGIDFGIMNAEFDIAA